MLSATIKNFLDEHAIKYSLISHAQAYTASQCAQAAHIKGGHFAKSVVVKLDHSFALAVIPACERLDLDKFRNETKAKHADVATEYEFQDRFLDSETGAMPPFGDLYNMDVYLADSLAQRDWLAFSAGNHNELLKVKGSDFLSLVHPKMLIHLH